MRIGVTEVYVDNQENARRFYTEVLGFQVKTDAAYGEGARWLTVVAPEDPDGTELLLAPLSEPAAALQRSRRESGTPAVSFSSTDCLRDYEELRARGATFLFEPRAMAYGGTDAVFEDSCGNLLNLHED